MVVFMIVLIYFSYSLYEDKKVYEEYISLEVDEDMSALAFAIIDSNELYKQILDRGVIANYEVDKLKKDAYTILEIPQKYGGLAFYFNRRTSEEFQNETAEQAAQIASFFSEMNKNEEIDDDNMDEVTELNKRMEEKIIQIQELNALWLSSLQKHVAGVKDDGGAISFDSREFQNHYGKNSFSHDFWIDFVIDIDHKTKDYIYNSGIESFEDILKGDNFGK